MLLFKKSKRPVSGFHNLRCQRADDVVVRFQLRGVRPFLSEKYDITRHPNYKYLSDANPRNAFDIEKYLSTRLVPKADEVYEVFDAGRV